MTNLGSKIRQFLRPFEGSLAPEPGLYHFERIDGKQKASIHLRVEPDGAGLLMVNASRAYHLNPVASHLAHLCLREVPEEKIVKSMNAAFNTSPEQVIKDLDEFRLYLSEIIRPDGACPVCDLQLETTSPFSSRPSAPYRMDLAITYRCNNDCAHCYNEQPRKRPELTTTEWKTILDRLWKQAIPHIVFTGGEPTLRPDLPELIAHAQKNGQITGLNTNGRRLKDKGFLNSLVEAGLDHIQITLESHDPAIHDRMVCSPGAWEETVAGIKSALATRLFIMTNTTMLRPNAGLQNLSSTLQFLAELGVPTIGLNALIYSGSGLNVSNGIPESELPPLLEIAREKTSHAGQRLIWYTPTQYCHFDPMQMELGVKGCTAALYNMCIEPDGAVIPCQSYYQPLGNILSDPWQAIWEHDLAVNLRQRNLIHPGCKECALLPECGGGCPLALMAGQTEDPKPVSSFQLEVLEKRK